MSFRVSLSKLQRVLNIFLFLLFLSYPTQLAKHFWPNFSYIWGIRVDYLSPTIYFSDLLLVIVIILFFLQGGYQKVKLLNLKTLLIILFLFLNVSFAFVPIVAFLKILKFIELGLFIYFLAAYNKLEVKTQIIIPLLISSLIVSVVGIFQFTKGSTLGGIIYFLGERHFSLETPGIALVSLLGKDYLRAYSFFSHPNSLGGYLLIVIFLVAFKAKKYLIYVIPLVFGFVLTFSKGAYLAFILSGFFLAILSWIKKVKIDYQKLTVGVLILVMFTTGIMFFTSKSISFETDNTRVTERVYLMQVSERLFLGRPLVGVGYNNFILGIPARLLQPVHNIYILSLVEGGLIGFGYFVYFLFLVLRKALKQKDRALILGLMAILVTGLFDHHWLSLQQNMLMASLVFGLTFREKIK